VCSLGVRKEKATGAAPLQGRRIKRFARGTLPEAKDKDDQKDTIHAALPKSVHLRISAVLRNLNSQLLSLASGSCGSAFA
jgi:hypothetical protein